MAKKATTSIEIDSALYKLAVEAFAERANFVEVKGDKTKEDFFLESVTGDIKNAVIAHNSRKASNEAFDAKRAELQESLG